MDRAVIASSDGSVEPRIVTSAPRVSLKLCPGSVVPGAPDVRSTVAPAAKRATANSVRMAGTTMHSRFIAASESRCGGAGFLLRDDDQAPARPERARLQGHLVNARRQAATRDAHVMPAGGQGRGSEQR